MQFYSKWMVNWFRTHPRVIWSESNHKLLMKEESWPELDLSLLWPLIREVKKVLTYLLIDFYLYVNSIDKSIKISEK